MPTSQDALEALSAISGATVQAGVPLSQYTRFAIGGPVNLLVDAATEQALIRSLAAAAETGQPAIVLGQGSNLIVSDEGFPGIVIRYTAGAIRIRGQEITVDAGAVLQNLVDASIEAGLEGLHTMTGIPGWVGAAVYGNAGAYGHSISEFVREVRYYDGAQVNTLDLAGCEFAYRESIFKRHKRWVILSASLQLPYGDRDKLREAADAILAIRNRKYPPSMKCAGSIFKNLLLRELPEAVRQRLPANVVREGKVPSGWFLEQVGAKGMTRGAMHVADYHGNLIYNAGGGTARDLVSLIAELKQRVRDEYGFDLEEEVQYVGFEVTEAGPRSASGFAG